MEARRIVCPHCGNETKEQAECSLCGLPLLPPMDPIRAAKAEGRVLGILVKKLVKMGKRFIWRRNGVDTTAQRNHPQSPTNPNEKYK